jgi:RNA polymerase sigma-B factor
VVADEDADHSISQLEAVDMLQPVLSELSPRDQQILRLRFSDGCSQTEIGKSVGISQMQVSRVLQRLLEDLRFKLTPARAA